MIGVDASRALRAQRTGTERYALEIIRHLLALPAAGAYQWRLYVDAPPPSAHYFQPDQHPTATGQRASTQTAALDVTVVRLPQQRLWTHRALAAEIKRHPPDLLFVPAHVLPFSAAALVRLFRPSRWRNGSARDGTGPNGSGEERSREESVPAVVTIHDLGYHLFPAAHSWFQRCYLPLSTRWNAAVAERVITPSTFTASELSARYGTAPAKINVIHEAATPSQPEPATEIHLEIPNSDYALYVGTLQPRKNLHRLLRAYAQLVQQQQISWQLVLAGAPGHRAATLPALAEELAVADRVHFLGYVPESALPQLYRNAHLFLFPSLFEGFGLPVLEAQSHGVPVMTAHNSSLPEIAGDGALLVDPTDVDAIANAMLQLSEDEALRQRLIHAGYANTKRFSWQRAAEETLALFQRVLAKERQQP